MRATDLAIAWIGIICVTALGLAMIGILAMVIVPAIKDPEAMKSLLTVAAIAGSGVIGLVGYLGGVHMGKDDTIKQATLSLEGGIPQIEEEVKP